MSKLSMPSDADVRVIGNRNQTTVPKAVLKAFALREGDFLKWMIQPDAITVIPMRLTAVLSEKNVSRMEAALKGDIAEGKIEVIKETK